ncbi:MAG: heme-binding beta-barrel domain-containing protein, partial [Anaerolineales bacterium]
IRKSHWESGVLRPMEDGSVELVCVQGSGRIEVLRGVFLAEEPQPGRLSLSFQSKFIGNDPRVESSRREWRFEWDRFEYIMAMATTNVRESSRHLKASLVKNG